MDTMSPDTLTWLLDADPSIRWQVLRDLTDAPDAEVAAERAKVATSGLGRYLLSKQDPDGRWDGGVYRPGWVQEDRPYFDAWTATHFALLDLAAFGLDPAGAEATAAVALVRDRVRWDDGGRPYFEGEIEPCINGSVLLNAAYYGQDGSEVAATLLRTRLSDGGWNCDDDPTVSSFHSTITPVEGLLAWERAGHATPEITAARTGGEDYLLERGLIRRRSTGELADPRFAMLSSAPRWFHDVLRGLDHFRLADRRDPRLADAVELVRAKADADGRWANELTHEGPTWFPVDEEGRPSRSVTLRVLRVLRWWDAGDRP